MIKILHMSDILSGSPECTLQDKIKLIRQAVRAYNLSQSIDYIVISGNITIDGNQNSFNQARDFLQEITDIFLKKNKGSITFNRVTIVPGINDIKNPGINENDYFNFKQFYDDFFKNELNNGIINSFTHTEAIVKEFKDLTFIGICCWNHSNTLLIDSIIERNINLINKIVTSQISSLEYVKNTPTILVSFENPLSGWTQAQIYDSDLREILSNQLKVSLNLFASGVASCIMPEPFSSKYISLGTGRRNQGAIWPLRMNIIEINKKISRDESQIKVNTKIYVNANALIKFNATSFWKQEDFFTSQIDQFYQEVPNNNYIAEEFLSKIEATILKQNSGLFLVKGLPGSGIKEIFNKLNENQIIQGLRIFSGEIRTYEDIHSNSYGGFNIISFDNQPSYRAEFVRIQNIINDLEDKNQIKMKIFIVIYDSAFRKTARGEQHEKLSKILEDLQTFNDYIIIYFMETMDISTDLEIENYKSVIKIDMMPESVDKLLKEYAVQIPIEKRQVKFFTNEYLGFTKLLLEGAKTKFDSWHGSEIIESQVSWKLLEQVILNSNEIKKRSQDFLNTIALCYGGVQLLHYIQELLQAAVSKNHLRQVIQSQSVIISADNLRQTYGNDLGNAALDIMKKLSEYQILEDTSNNETYRLLLIIPFLISIYKYRVFISFPSYFEHEANQLSNDLKRIGLLEGKHIEVWIFTERVGEGAGISSRINEGLKNWENLVVLFKDDEQNSKYVLGEYHKWYTNWRDKVSKNEARCIPVSFGNISNFPYEFGDYDIINANTGLTDNVIKKILRLLIAY